MTTEEKPQSTIRYLGTDQHSKKVLEGKFGSNVAPRKAHWSQAKREDWECPDCEAMNRYYLANCPFCYQRRP